MKINTATRTCQRNAALLLLSGVLSVSVFAQSQPPATKAVKAAPKQVQKAGAPPSAAVVETPVAEPKPFAPVFFDPAVSVLQYAQNDPPKVYALVQEQLASVPGKPDKFSSPQDRSAYDAAIVARMESIGPIPIIGRCTAEYDAAAETYEIKSRATPVQYYFQGSTVSPADLNLRQIFLVTANKKVDNYEAKNAYGATTKVYRRRQDNYVFVVPGGSGNEPSPTMVKKIGYDSGFINYWRTDYDYRQVVKMPRDVARVSEKDIACLYVVSLVAPWVVKYSESKYPSLDEPFDVIESYLGFYGKLDMVAVINSASGEIYSKVERSR